MTQIDKKLAREIAFNLAQEESKKEDYHYTTYSPFYTGPLMNAKGILDVINVEDKKVLSLGAAGLLGFESLIKGAKQIDLFDINYLQKVFFLYLKTGVKHLNYKDFIKHFCVSKNNLNEIPLFLNNDIYQDLHSELPEEVKYTFDPIFDYFDQHTIVNSKLLRSPIACTEDNMKHSSLYHEDGFKIAQERLNKEKDIFTYKTTSLTGIEKELPGKYDTILLDNLLSYYQDMPDVGDKGSLYMLLRILENKLEPNGTIQSLSAFYSITYLLKAIYDNDYSHKYSPTKKEAEMRKTSLQRDTPFTDLIEVFGYKTTDIPAVDAAGDSTKKNIILTKTKK